MYCNLVFWPRISHISSDPHPPGLMHESKPIRCHTFSYVRPRQTLGNLIHLKIQYDRSSRYSLEMRCSSLPSVKPRVPSISSRSTEPPLSIRELMRGWVTLMSWMLRALSHCLQSISSLKYRQWSSFARASVLLTEKGGSLCSDRKSAIIIQ